MYIEFIEAFAGYPQVVIAPIKPDLADGRLFVTPLHIDLDRGRYVLSPTITANVSLGEMTAESANQWGECLQVASAIASRKLHPWINTDEALKMWNRVDEIIGELKA